MESAKVKDVVIPDSMRPNRLCVNKISVRWFEYEGVIYLDIDDFCTTMKYPRPYVLHPPRIIEQPWYATNGGRKYINGDVLRRHPKVYCTVQEKAERHVWDKFRALVRQSAMSSSQNTSSST